MDTKSAWLSKINWTQAVGIAAMAAAYFGVNIDDATKAELVALIGSLTAVITWVLRTFFTKKLTHASVG